VLLTWHYEGMSSLVAHRCRSVCSSALPPRRHWRHRWLAGACGSRSEGAMTGCESGEVQKRTMLASISRACSRSALALISRYAPSFVDAHASSGAFALINSNFSASSTRAKITVSSPSASLPTHEPQLLACDRVIDLALYCYWCVTRESNRSVAGAARARTNGERRGCLRVV